MKFPSALILTVLWAVSKFVSLDTSVSQPTGVALLILTFGSALYEFYKSADLSVSAFAADTACSVAQAIVATVTVVYNLDYITLPDAILCLTVVADGIFSPVNSFKTALRNFGGEGAHHPHH